jgi:hypothetical protein
LRFTVSHKSELFWKANFEIFCENNSIMLQLLKELLRVEDSDTGCIVCHDLDEFSAISRIDVYVDSCSEC